MEYQSGMDGHHLRDEVTTSIRVHLFIPRAESVPCCGCFSLICICSSNASLSAHQANATLSFSKRVRPCPPAYVDRFRSEDLLIYNVSEEASVMVSPLSSRYSARKSFLARESRWRTAASPRSKDMLAIGGAPLVATGRGSRYH